MVAAAEPTDGEAATTMTAATAGGGADVAFKIARLVEEKGWNQEDFARISHLNRHTVRQILNAGPKRRLRNATVSQCADALGLTVSELRSQSLDRLLPRMHGKPPEDGEALQLLRENAALPELVEWIKRNEVRAASLRADEIHELLDMQQAGGPLERFGVDQVVERLERRRRLLAQVRTIAGSEHLDLLEQMVGLLYEKVSSSGARR
jgi:transcriptional regulator with XRE-family HTH domain